MIRINNEEGRLTKLALQYFIHFFTYLLRIRDISIIYK